MRHISPESIDKYSKRFELYMKKYGLLYEEREREFIKANFLNSYFAEGIDIDIMNQVYETIGLFDNYMLASFTIKIGEYISHLGSATWAEGSKRNINKWVAYNAKYISLSHSTF